jgi:putative transposase
MSSRIRYRDRRTIAISIANWVGVDEGAFCDSDAEIFRKRKESINLYARSFSLGEIKKVTQIKPKDLYRFLDRCEAQNADGRLNGWRGIIPRERIVQSCNRRDDNQARLGHANQFQQFLINNPEIKNNLESLATCGRRVGEKGPKRKLPVQTINSELISLCRAAGLSAADYPLNVASLAYGAIRRFVAQVRGRDFGKSGAVGGVSNLPLVTRCYQRLEADGHWKDIICTVELPSPTGRGVYYLPIERLWLIPVLETQSTAALGYAIAYGANYSGGDLVRAIRAATLPWIPLELTAKGLRYCANGGFPSGLDEQLAFVCADEILLDNHKGHLSDYAVGQIHRTLGATPVFGAIDNPNARACAEGFFSKLEEMVFHTLPNSTGSTSRNRDIKNPAENAVKYKITDQHIHEIAEVALARYNSECPPGSSLSRVEILQRYVRDPRSLVRRIPSEEREQIRLYDLELVLKIKGNVENGIRPHVYFLESRYTNPVIASSYGLIGKHLRAYGYSGDIRTFDAYFESGASAGTVLCERRFRSTTHSLLTRKHSNASRRTGGHRPNSMGDDIAGYRESLTAKAPKSKSAATELARFNAESRENLRRKGGKNEPNVQEIRDNKATRTDDTGDWTDGLSKLGTQF